MPNQVSDLISKFNQWRKLKKSPKEKIPEHLWALAREVQQEFPHLKIYRFLNITSTNWKKFVLLEKETKSSQSTKFVNVPATVFSVAEKTASQIDSRRESLQINIGKNIQIFIYGDV